MYEIIQFYLLFWDNVNGFKSSSSELSVESYRDVSKQYSWQGNLPFL